MLSIEKCENRLVKILVSDACINNCFYCPFSRERDFKRHVYEPLKLAKNLSELFDSDKSNGVFISSSIVKNPFKAQEKIIETAYYLRKKFSYNSYLHLKIMPSVDEDSIRETVILADRVSINLEAPNEFYLKKIAPEKNFKKDLLGVLFKIRKVKNYMRELYGKKFLRAGISTQFVVGPGNIKDFEYLKTSYYLIKNKLVDTVYFSAFHPVRGTRFENYKPVSKLREKRLYQAFKLLKYYGFNLKEIYFDESFNLPLNKDPKEIWAEKNKEFFPVDIKKADFEELIRVPGIGPKRARKMLKLRKDFSIYFPEKILKIIPEKSFRYLVFKGKRISVISGFFP